MNYVATLGPSFSQNPAISDIPSVSDVFKKISLSFVDTLSLGRRDSLKSKLYEEYLELAEEREKLNNEIAEMELQVSLMNDALQFIDCLSLESSFPDISGDTEDISLEWINSKSEELIITFKGYGKIIYSGIIDNGTVSGVAIFKSKEIPKNIEPLIKIFDK